MLLDNIFQFKALTHRPIIIIVRKLQGTALASCPSCHGIIVERDAIHQVAGLLHQHLCPVVVVVAGARGNLVELVAVIVAAVGGVAAIKVRVILGQHVATATPALVAHAEELHFPGLVTAVLAAQLCHGGVSVTGHVLHPLGQFLHGARAHVAADVRLRAQHLAKVQELMGTERVVLDGATPVVVLHLGAVLLGADAIHPVILIGETSARPSQHGDLQLLECVEHVSAITLGVGNGGVLTHPKATIDAGTQVLGELSVNLLVDFLCALVCVQSARYLLCGECE